MEQTGAVWRYHVAANGFLYHMVRIAVGAMLNAAATKNLVPMEEALAHPHERKVGQIAPACGLILENIAYDCCLRGMEGS
jgi:tRNA U38,U39,U40 pseudouridine synthase TruA